MNRHKLLKLLHPLLLMLISLILPVSVVTAETRTLETDDGTEIDIRVFPGSGDTLLLGFACDEGHSLNQEETAAALAESGVEVWMPDMLGALMLPKVRSSIYEIPTEALTDLVKLAIKQTDKKRIFLIAAGPETELVLRAAAKWEAIGKELAGSHRVQGGILMFPRLIDGKPEPGTEPEYVAAVGKTTLPLFLLEGERTPNRWGLQHLTNALEAGGSKVNSRLIPGVRGYFFSRDDASESESLVTSQLSGMIKASLFMLKDLNNETH